MFNWQMATLVMIFTPLQLSSVHHNPSCNRCARDAEQNRMRREFGRKKFRQGKI